MEACQKSIIGMLLPVEAFETRNEVNNVHALTIDARKIKNLEVLHIFYTETLTSAYAKNYINL